MSGLLLESPFNTMEDEVKKHQNHYYDHHHDDHHHHHCPYQPHQVKKFKTARFAAWLGGFDIKEELEKANVEFRTEFWLPKVIIVLVTIVALVIIIIELFTVLDLGPDCVCAVRTVIVLLCMRARFQCC